MDLNEMVLTSVSFDDDDSGLGMDFEEYDSPSELVRDYFSKYIHVNNLKVQLCRSQRRSSNAI